MAVYATPRNFERCGLVDPELMEKEEQAKLSKFEDEEEDDEDLKAADLLRRYLRNKMVGPLFLMHDAYYLYEDFSTNA